MSLQVGIVGLPNVGKSTLFKALTNNSVDINNYPFCTIEPNVGIVEVPDIRLNKLAKMSNSQKIISATVEFLDIAGLVKGASEGEGLGNKFLANIRSVDVIAQVVRVFKNDDITHVHNSVNPLRDIEIIETELILADIVTIDKTITRLEKKVRSNNKEAIVQMNIVKNIQKALDEGILASNVDIDIADELVKQIITEMSLLTMKPIIYIYNVINVDDKLNDELELRPHVKLDIKIEEELLNMTLQDIKELGIESHLNDLITKSFKLLGLQTFFTTGESETRAWTIKRGFTAPEAGAVIHNDFKDLFIRADVINWERLLEIGSLNTARENGLIKTVGKDYIMQDGDVMEFKI